MAGKITRETIAPGVYQDQYGYAVRWVSHGIRREKRFPRDTPIEVVKAFRARQVQQAAPPPDTPTSSFVRDIVTFLRTRKGKKCYKADRAHLRPWARRFPGKSRWSITRDDVMRAIAEWTADDYSAREIGHRVKLLKQVYLTLEPGSATPCDRVKLPTPPKTRPMGVAPALVRQVAANLVAAEQCGHLRDAKTRARYLVLATTGQRPAQVQRAEPFDVDLEARRWIVRPAKGDNGTIVYLNDDMVAAWQLFISAQAWGAYDSRSFARTLRSSGWPEGVRPYNLRHRVGLALSEAGVDLGDIQAHMGHSTPTTTRQFYVPVVPARLQLATQRIAGTFTPDHFAPPAPRLNKRTRASADAIAVEAASGGRR